MLILLVCFAYGIIPIQKVHWRCVPWRSALFGGSGNTKDWRCLQTIRTRKWLSLWGEGTRQTPENLFQMVHRLKAGKLWLLHWDCGISAGCPSVRQRPQFHRSQPHWQLLALFYHREYLPASWFYLYLLFSERRLNLLSLFQGRLSISDKFCYWKIFIPSNCLAVMHDAKPLWYWKHPF